MSETTRDPATFAFSESALATVRGLLAERWDLDGAIRTAAPRRVPQDPAAPRSLDDYTFAVCGMLAAGATKANVVDYLRGEEIALLGAARTPPRELGTIGRAAWLAVRGMSDDAAEQD